MLKKDRMKTPDPEVTLILPRNDIEKPTWRTHRYFVDFESRINVEIFTSNRCHNFHWDSPFKIDVISTNFPRGILTSNRWQIDKDVSIGLRHSSVPYRAISGEFLKNYKSTIFKNLLLMVTFT